MKNPLIEVLKTKWSDCDDAMKVAMAYIYFSVASFAGLFLFCFGYIIFDIYKAFTS